MTQVQQEDAPEVYRARYAELKAQAAAVNAARTAAAHRPLPTSLASEQILARETVPGGRYWTGRLARGQMLRLENPHATPGVSLILWNADEPSERFNHGDTVKLQWTVRLGAGKLLMSDMGRVLASISDEAGGALEPVLGGSSPASNLRRHGDAALPSAQENFLLAVGKLGLSPRDIGSVLNIFAPVVTDADGGFSWRADDLAAGGRIDLRAEMNLLVAVSNTPHPLAPPGDFDARPITVTRWRSEVAPADDPCRTASGEAERAFQNTEAFFAE